MTAIMKLQSLFQGQGLYAKKTVSAFILAGIMVLPLFAGGAREIHSIFLSCLLLAAGFQYFRFRNEQKDIRVIPEPPIDAIRLFALIAVLSIMFSQDIHRSIVSAVFTVSIVLLCVILYGISLEDMYEMALPAVFFSSLLQSGIGIFQSVLPVFRDTAPDFYAAGLTFVKGTFLHSAVFAVFLFLGLAAGIFYYNMKDKQSDSRGIFQRAASVFGCVIIVYAVILSRESTGVFSALFGLGMTVILIRNTIRKKTARIFILVLAYTACGLGLWGGISSSGNNSGMICKSADTHADRAGLGMIRQYPFFGIGPGNYFVREEPCRISTDIRQDFDAGQVYFTPNILLQAGAEYGVFAMVLAGIILFYPLVCAFRKNVTDLFRDAKRSRIFLFCFFIYAMLLARAMADNILSVPLMAVLFVFSYAGILKECSSGMRPQTGGADETVNRGKILTAKNASLACLAGSVISMWLWAGTVLFESGRYTLAKYFIPYSSDLYTLKAQSLETKPDTRHDAVLQYGRAARLSRRNPVPSFRYLRALTEYFPERREQIFYVFQRSVRMNARNAALYNIAADYAASLSDHKRAIECYEKALVIEDMNIYARYGKGRVYFNTGEIDAALEEFMTIVRRKAVTDSNLRIPYGQKGLFDVDRAQLYCYIARSWIEKNNLQQARYYLSLCQEHPSSYKGIDADIARAYYSMAQYRHALLAIDRAIKENPSSDLYQQERIRILDAMKNAS